MHSQSLLSSSSQTNLSTQEILKGQIIILGHGNDDEVGLGYLFRRQIVLLSRFSHTFFYNWYSKDAPLPIELQIFRDKLSIHQVINTLKEWNPNFDVDRRFPDFSQHGWVPKGKLELKGKSSKQEEDIQANNRAMSLVHTASSPCLRMLSSDIVRRVTDYYTGCENIELFKVLFPLEMEFKNEQDEYECTSLKKYKELVQSGKAPILIVKVKGALLEHTINYFEETYSTKDVDIHVYQVFFNRLDYESYVSNHAAIQLLFIEPSEVMDAIDHPVLQSLREQLCKKLSPRMVDKNTSLTVDVFLQRCTFFLTDYLELMQCSKYNHNFVETRIQKYISQCIGNEISKNIEKNSKIIFLLLAIFQMIQGNKNRASDILRLASLVKGMDILSEFLSQVSAFLNTPEGTPYYLSEKIKNGMITNEFENISLKCCIEGFIYYLLIKNKDFYKLSIDTKHLFNDVTCIARYTLCHKLSDFFPQALTRLTENALQVFENDLEMVLELREIFSFVEGKESIFIELYIDFFEFSIFVRNTALNQPVNFEHDPMKLIDRYIQLFPEVTSFAMAIQNNILYILKSKPLSMSQKVLPLSTLIRFSELLYPSTTTDPDEENIRKILLAIDSAKIIVKKKESFVITDAKRNLSFTVEDRIDLSDNVTEFSLYISVHDCIFLTLDKSSLDTYLKICSMKNTRLSYEDGQKKFCFTFNVSSPLLSVEAISNMIMVGINQVFLLHDYIIISNFFYQFKAACPEETVELNNLSIDKNANIASIKITSTEEIYIYIFAWCLSDKKVSFTFDGKGRCVFTPDQIAKFLVFTSENFLSNKINRFKASYQKLQEYVEQEKPLSFILVNTGISVKVENICLADLSEKLVMINNPIKKSQRTRFLIDVNAMLDIENIDRFLGIVSDLRIKHSLDEQLKRQQASDAKAKETSFVTLDPSLSFSSSISSAEEKFQEERKQKRIEEANKKILIDLNKQFHNFCDRLTWIYEKGTFRLLLDQAEYLVKVQNNGKKSKETVIYLREELSEFLMNSLRFCHVSMDRDVIVLEDLTPEQKKRLCNPQFWKHAPIKKSEEPAVKVGGNDNLAKREKQANNKSLAGANSQVRTLQPILGKKEGKTKAMAASAIQNITPSRKKELEKSHFSMPILSQKTTPSSLSQKQERQQQVNLVSVGLKFAEQLEIVYQDYNNFKSNIGNAVLSVDIDPTEIYIYTDRLKYLMFIFCSECIQALSMAYYRYHKSESSFAVDMISNPELLYPWRLKIFKGNDIFSNPIFFKLVEMISNLKKGKEIELPTIDVNEICELRKSDPYGLIKAELTALSAFVEAEMKYSAPGRPLVGILIDRPYDAYEAWAHIILLVNHYNRLLKSKKEDAYWHEVMDVFKQGMEKLKDIRNQHGHRPDVFYQNVSVVAMPRSGQFNLAEAISKQMGEIKLHYPQCEYRPQAHIINLTAEVLRNIVELNKVLYKKLTEQAPLRARRVNTGASPSSTFFVPQVECVSSSSSAVSCIESSASVVEENSSTNGSSENIMTLSYEM